MKSLRNQNIIDQKSVSQNVISPTPFNVKSFIWIKQPVMKFEVS